MRHGAASQQGGVRARQRRFVVHDKARRVLQRHESDRGILSRQTSYSGKKKKKGPLGLRYHNMVSEPRFINT